MATALSLSLAAPAWAQERPVDDPEGLVENSEPLGLRAGTVIVYPRISADIRYDSNVYNQPDAIGDGVLVARPGVRVQTDLSRHAVRLDLTSEIRRYFDLKSENSEQWAARAEGRLDLAQAVTITPAVLIARRIERRGTFGDVTPINLEPASYLEKTGSVRIERSRGVLDLMAEAGRRKLDYHDVEENGLVLDQSFRDVRTDWVRARIGVRRSERLSLFVQGRVNWQRYETRPDANSKGFSVLGGVRYDITGQLRAEAGVGYLQQDFADPLEPRFKGLDYTISATWTPQQRVRVELRGSRDIERSPLPGVTAVIESRFEAAVTYAVNRKILAGLEGGFVRNQYRGTTRRDDRFYVDATARYQLTPRLAAVAGAGWRTQNGNGPGGRDYNGFNLRVGISFTP